MGLALELSPTGDGGAAGVSGPGEGLAPCLQLVQESLADIREQAVTHLTSFVWDSIVAVGSFAMMDNQLGGNSAPGRGANK